MVFLPTVPLEGVLSGTNFTKGLAFSLKSMSIVSLRKKK